MSIFVKFDRDEKRSVISGIIDLIQMFLVTDMIDIQVSEEPSRLM